MGCETASGPDQVPVGGVAARLLTSVRGPEAKLRSRREAPEASALRVAEPDSSSEPAMRRAVPERVTSERDALPVRAARDCWRSWRACGLLVGVGCWASAGNSDNRQMK